MTKSHSNSIYRHEFTVSQASVDLNGHVNNVIYVQWMQDIAILHCDATGGTRATQAAGATWVARSHKIEYLKPAFSDETVLALSWVADFRRVRSLRHYRFLRQSDNTLLARGETDWVFVDAKTGRPRTIPEEVARLFPLVPQDQEPC